jgi:predicted site-specific integrase-resolvase/transposase
LHQLCTSEIHQQQKRNAKSWLNHNLAFQAQIQSGEGGNRRPGFSVTSLVEPVAAQVAVWFVVTVLWLVFVVCGCFGKSGNRISTNSAQFDLAASGVIAGVVPEGRAARRRRKRLQKESERDDESEIAASYSRFSSNQQRDESVTQQQVEARKLAESNAHDLRLDLQFSDEAVSGTKRNRRGLNEMLRAAEAGEFKVLYFYSISRLARESVITMPILKRLVHTHGVRVISVTEGVDSEVGGWEVLATILSLVSERFLKELSVSVFRGQQGALAEGYSVGDWCFGYGSEPADGTESGRRGRNAKPRMKYIIDAEEASWVRRIFHWFVVERQSITWIVRQLNAENAPKDHRSSTKEWRHSLVTELLSRTKYVGVWIWGQNQNVRDPETGVIRQELRSDEETEAWVRHFPELAIIDLDLFTKAQELLEENERKYGHIRNSDGELHGSHGNADSGHPRHLLSGLIKCAQCGCNFVTGGSGNKYMFCPAYRRGTCSCKTQLNRARAEMLILEAVGQRILQSSDWTQAVIDAAVAAWHERDARIPGELASVRQQISDLERRRDRLIDEVETGKRIADLVTRLERREDEIRILREQEAGLLQNQNESDEPPTEDWLCEQLGQLGTVINEKTPAAAYALRDLVGGSITVHEVRREGRQRHYLRAAFRLQTTSLADSLGLLLKADDGLSDADQQIEIDMLDPEAGNQVAEARRLYDQDMPNKDIATRLGVSKGRVTALLKQSFDAAGEEMPDGRSRRAKIRHRNEPPAKHITIADDVMSLCDKGLLLVEIAERLDVCRDLITQAIRWWHESRGLPVPDGRGRRRQLDRKSRSS